MEIFINGESVSYTLEGEKNLCDVFSSLEKTIATSDGIVTALSLNGNNIARDEKSLKVVTLEEIARLEIESQHKSCVRAQQLELVCEYIHSIVRVAQRAMSEPDTQASEYNIHAEDIQSVAQHMDILCKSDDLGYSALHYLFMNACKMLGLLARDAFDGITSSQEAIDILHNVLAFLKQYTFTAQNDARAAARSNELMMAHIPHLIKIAHLLTTGDEKYALHYFIGSVDFISMWLILIACVCDNAESREEGATVLPWRDVHKKFADVLEELLQELSAAFEAQDWITVSDLIEYEIAPKIKEHAISMREHY